MHENQYDDIDDRGKDDGDHPADNPPELDVEREFAETLQSIERVQVLGIEVSERYNSNFVKNRDRVVIRFQASDDQRTLEDVSHHLDCYEGWNLEDLYGNDGVRTMEVEKIL